nr:DnaB-like helicase N-terminal domain-containing protein [Rhodococcus sp. 15-649-1-2]
MPTAECLLIGAMVWTVLDIARVLVGLVDVDDFEEAGHRTIWQAITSLVQRGIQPTGAVLNGELMRAGELSGDRGKIVVRKLMDAVTSGANDLAPQPYAEAVVAASYRRRLHSAGVSLAEFSETLPESDLMPILTTFGVAARDHERRLTALRGGGNA